MRDKKTKINAHEFKIHPDSKAIIAALILALITMFYFEYNDLYCDINSSGNEDCSKLRFEWNIFEYLINAFRIWVILNVGMFIQRSGNSDHEHDKPVYVDIHPVSQVREDFTYEGRAKLLANKQKS